MARKFRCGLEPLENRLLLAVTAMVTDGGDLIVEGDAEAAIVISAQGEGNFLVTEGGNPVGEGDGIFAGVVDDIKIKLNEVPESTEEAPTSADDDVRVELGEEAVDTVVAKLGQGVNSFALTGGSASRLYYRGGSAEDSVSVDTAVEQFVFTRLGHGENDVEILGDVGHLLVYGGRDGDQVQIGEEASTAHSVRAYLGDGTNVVETDGAIGGYLKVATRHGDDSVTVGEDAVVTGGVKAYLGGGLNSLTIEGAVERSVYYEGRDGDDSLQVLDGAAIGGDIYAKLGGGENSLLHEANTTGESPVTTLGDLTAVSKNAEDVFTVAEGSVEGEVHLGPGEQQDRFHGWWWRLRRFFGRR